MLGVLNQATDQQSRNPITRMIKKRREANDILLSIVVAALRPRISPRFGGFPKFVLGFVVTSKFVTWVTSGYSLADFNKLANPGLVAPIKDLRTWAFIFCFLSIGLTTRFRELAKAGTKPFVAHLWRSSQRRPRLCALSLRVRRALVCLGR
jgi:Conserved hypothetical protein 698